MKKIYTIAAMIMLLAAVPAFSAVKVISVKGEAGVLNQGKVQPLTAGMNLSVGSTVITGVNSQAVLDVDGSRLTVKPLSNMKIAMNRTTKDSSDTRVALKRGRVVSEVNRISNVKTRFKVATPVATSSVRGTKHTVSFTTETGMKVVVEDGEVAIEGKGGERLVRRGFLFRKSPTDKGGFVAVELKDGALTDTAPLYLTADETALNEFYSDFFGSHGDFMDMINFLNALTSGNVRMEIILR